LSSLFVDIVTLLVAIKQAGNAAGPLNVTLAAVSACASAHRQ
jgi:hypothetical protein